MRMRLPVNGVIGRAKRRLVNDLKTDPYLPLILVIAAVLVGFWFWHLIPNFATRDEHARLLDVLPALGALVVDPSFESLQIGVTQGRMYGATFYLNAIALIPAVVFAAATGVLDAFIPFYRPYRSTEIWAIDTDLWHLWHDTPEWIWTSSLLILRLFTVLFALGCVYLTYRIGTTIRDRATGRLASALLALTFGFVVTAHEGGEDIPMLFFLLLVIYLSLRYLETGNENHLLAGCAIGGFAIAFKLTAVIGVVALGTAYLLRAYRTGTVWYVALARPRLIGTGMLLGVIAIAVGYPSILLSGPDALVDRIFRGTSNKGSVAGGRVAPTWWWFLRSYLNGLGLPLFLAGIGGILANVAQLRPRSRSESESESESESREIDGVLVVLAVFASCVFMLSWWEYIRVHHLLPTFPLIVLLVSTAVLRLRDRTPLVARSLVVILLVSSGLYTGYGDVAYATQPRDEAAAWLDEHASDTATVEVYESDMQDSAVPHGMSTSHYSHKTDGGLTDLEKPSVTEWMQNMPERCPEYIQLTNEDLLYLAPSSPNARAGFYYHYPERAEYIRNLLTDDSDGYEIVAEFGDRPLFLGGTIPAESMPELLRVGVIPRTVQYGDEQDLGPEQYTIILKRTGPCARSGTRQPSQLKHPLPTDAIRSTVAP